MGVLLQKEFRLAMHPITPVMLALCTMVLIPNYPYSVLFFYLMLAIFFTCLLGRENNDIIYTMMLPVGRRELVRARFGFTVIIELVQMMLVIPFALLRDWLKLAPNAAGMEANPVLFAEGFALFGLFNLVFYCSYYKAVNRVGISFLKASAAVFLLIMLECFSTYAIPFVRDVLDTPGFTFAAVKMAALLIGMLLYVLLTMIAYRKSVRSFEKQDLQI